MNLALALGVIAAMSLSLLLGHTFTGYEIGIGWFLIGGNLGIWSTRRIRENIERSYPSPQAGNRVDG